MRIKNALAGSTLDPVREVFQAYTDEYLKVSVLQGRVTVTKGKREPVTIRAGHTKVFRSGGEPTDMQELEDEWRELMGDQDEDGDGNEASSSESSQSGQ